MAKKKQATVYLLLEDHGYGRDVLAVFANEADAHRAAELLPSALRAYDDASDAFRNRVGFPDKNATAHQREQWMAERAAALESKAAAIVSLIGYMGGSSMADGYAVVAFVASVVR